MLTSYQHHAQKMNININRSCSIVALEKYESCSSVSDMHAQCECIVTPLVEKTPSTGTNVAGVQKVLAE